MDFDPSLAFVRCPKHCDVRTPPEPTGDGNYVCSACGHVFEFRVARTVERDAFTPRRRAK